MVTFNQQPEADDLQITPHLPADQLPAMLNDCLSVAQSTATKDMLLMSMLTTTSSVMNNISFRYAHYGKRYYPNLLTFLMAGAASGKGIADLAKRLVEPIHEDNPLLIPGDSTYPAFFEQLYLQRGRGLLFETEGSVITDIWRAGCTNYNTALRKAAEHETLSKARILTGRTEIPCPKVSVLLTGTCSQFQALVPNVENGFFSRLNMLMIRSQQPFDGSVFLPADRGTEVESKFAYWAAQLKQWQDSQSEPIEFCLTTEQARQIGSIMESEYGEYLRQLGDGFHATIIRNGITLMRVACILRVLRMVDNREKGDTKLLCADQDFQSAMVISTKLLLNAADAYNQIGGKDQPSIPEQKGSYQRATFLASLPHEFTTGECIHQAEKMGVSERTCKRWLNDWSSMGLLTHDYGKYAKVG